MSDTPTSEAAERIKALEREVRLLQKKLIRSEANRTLLESAPNPMVISNAEGIIEMVNRQTEVLFGFSHGELVGNPISTLIPDQSRTAAPG